MLFGDGVQDHGAVGEGVGLGVGPDEPGQPVGGGDVGGHRFDLGSDDAGGREGFADDGGPVGAVAGERFAGPLPGDQDAAAAAAAVFAIMGFRRTAVGDRAGPGVGRLDAVAEPVRTGRRAGQPAKLVGEPVDVRVRRRAPAGVAARVLAALGRAARCVQRPCCRPAGVCR